MAEAFNLPYITSTAVNPKFCLLIDFTHVHVTNSPRIGLTYIQSQKRWTIVLLSMLQNVHKSEFLILILQRYELVPMILQLILYCIHCNFLSLVQRVLS